MHAFEENSDMYDYCSVAKTSHLGYDSYIFEFVPDPTMPWLNFRVVMFSHSILPISDYFSEEGNIGGSMSRHYCLQIQNRKDLPVGLDIQF